MYLSRTIRALAILVTIVFVLAVVASADRDERAPQGKHFGRHGYARQRVQLGPRPFYLVDKMEESWLKRKLQRWVVCSNSADNSIAPTTG